MIEISDSMKGETVGRLAAKTVVANKSGVLTNHWIVESPRSKTSFCRQCGAELSSISALFARSLLRNQTDDSSFASSLSFDAKQQPYPSLQEKISKLKARSSTDNGRRKSVLRNRLANHKEPTFHRQKVPSLTPSAIWLKRIVRRITNQGGHVDEMYLPFRRVHGEKIDLTDSEKCADV